MSGAPTGSGSGIASQLRTGSNAMSGASRNVSGDGEQLFDATSADLANFNNFENVPRNNINKKMTDGSSTAANSNAVNTIVNGQSSKVSYGAETTPLNNINRVNPSSVNNTGSAGQ